MRVLAVIAVFACYAGATADPAESAPELLNAPDVDAARRRYERGAALFDQGRFEDARREFEEAKRLRPVAALDYNIARCHDRMEHWREAADAYQRYLDGTPNAPDRAEVAERIRLLRSRVAEPAPVAAPAPAPAPVEKPPVYRRWWLWTAVAAVAVAGVAVGVGVGVGTSSRSPTIPTTTDGAVGVTFP